MISVVVGTYGDRAVWDPLARRAMESTEAQTVYCEAIHQHGETLAAARNAGVAASRGDHVVFLDADDCLDPLYIESMTAALVNEGDALYQPMTIGVREDGTRDDAPVFIEPRNLLEHNHLCIGTMVPRKIFDSVGGFYNWPVLEDWCLFIRSWQAGCELRRAPGAIYEVTVRDVSRNTDQAIHHRTYNEICQRYRRQL